MKPAITIAALAGLTTPALAQNIATVTLTTSVMTVATGDTFTIGVVLSDNIPGNSVFAFDIEVASAGVLDIVGVGEPVADSSVFGFNGASTSTGATGLGGSSDILGPTLDDPLDGLTVFTFQVTAGANVGSRTFTAMDGPGPNPAVQYALNGGIVLIPENYDEIVFNSVTVSILPAPASLTLLALTSLACGRRRR